MDFTIEEMKASDWKQVADIYLSGIKTEIATFQSEVPSWEEWNNSHLKLCRLIARRGDNVLGWTALSPTSSRCVYAGVAEVSIYIGEYHKRQGVGTTLLNAVIELSEENGFWTLQAGIIKENSASLNLHKKCGFRELGTREKIAKMRNGRWHDVISMERRSKLVGID